MCAIVTRIPNFTTKRNTLEYQQYLDDHDEHKIEREKFLRNVKKRRPKQLDDEFQQAHDEAFEEIDCLKCGNCCKTTSPIFRDVDVKRIAKKLKMPQATFEKTLLRKDEDGDWVLQTAPCTFLQPDNTCFIYDIRPQACREYPHTDRKRMFQVTDLAFRNGDICPAASKIIGEVMKSMT